MRIIDITKSEKSNSSMDVITTGEVIFLMLDMADLKDLILTEKQNASGIYLLIGEQEIYIGQADDISKRLDQHAKDIAKDWVTRIIFFTNKDGVVGKDMLNYMERKLIEHFKWSARELKNNNSGQESSIFLQNQIKSDNLLNHFHDILGLFNIELMTLELSDDTVKQESLLSQDLSIELNGKIYDLTQGKQIDTYFRFISDLYILKPEIILDSIQNGKPGFGNIFGTEHSIFADGSRRSKWLSLDDKEIAVYSNLNAEQKLKKMQQLKDRYLSYREEEMDKNERRK